MCELVGLFDDAVRCRSIRMEPSATKYLRAAVAGEQKAQHRISDGMRQVRTGLQNAGM